jgi:hypothetical protein
MKNVIRWGGIAIIAAGTIMWVVTGFTSTDGEGFLNGWVFFPSFLFFVPMLVKITSGPSASAFRGGELAMGTLRETRQTGLIVNDQPQLDLIFTVETADGQSFEGRARQIVPLTELAELTPGRMLPLRYLPGRADGLVGIATDATPDQVQELMLRRQVATGRLTPDAVRIVREGVQAQAVVMALAPTGEVRNGDAVIDLTLRITRPDGSVFDSTVSRPLPAAALPGLQVGCVTGVRYLSDNEADVLIEARLA